LTTLLAFLLTLGTLIVAHEYGHYRAARWCGVRVLRFSVGFGRVLWRRQPQAGGTEFTLSALPLGGYVKMLDSREGPVAPADLAQAFDRQPLRARAAIVAAGPAANLLLAVLLYAAAHWWGLQEPSAVLAAPPAGSMAAQAGLRAGDWVRAAADGQGGWHDVLSLTDLRWQITRATLDGQPLAIQLSDRDGAHSHILSLPLDRLGGRELGPAEWSAIGVGAPFVEPVLGQIKIGGAAALAGLREGDRVLSVDDQAVPDAAWLRERIRASAAAAQAAMDWQIERAQQRLILRVEPRPISEGGQRIGRIDAYIGQGPEMTTVQLGPWAGLGAGVERTWEMSFLSLRMIGRMLTGQASLRQLSGPLTIADYAGQSVLQGVAYYLQFLALVSVSLGVLNLLPLPMLDGGHLIYYVYEGVIGRPISDLWLTWLQRGGAVVLLLMMSIALSNDVARLLGLQ